MFLYQSTRVCEAKGFNDSRTCTFCDDDDDDNARWSGSGKERKKHKIEPAAAAHSGTHVWFEQIWVHTCKKGKGKEEGAWA